jgi:polyferredoxin
VSLPVVVAAVVIASMISVIIYTERVMSLGQPSKQKKYVLYFVLFMMATMFIGLGWYLSVPPGFLNAIIAFNIVMIPMIAFVVLLFYFYTIPPKIQRNHDRLIFPSFFVLNELFMTYFIFIILGVRFSAGLWSAIPEMVNSFVFVGPMGVEMIFSIIFFKLRGTARYLLVALTLMDVLSPAIIQNYAFVLFVVNVLIMVGGMIIILEEVASSKTRLVADKKKIIDISIVIYLMNAVGFFVVYSAGSNSTSNWFPYSLSILIGMGLYFFYTFSGRENTTVPSWVEKKWWLFFVLFGTFVVELVMSIPLDIFTGIFTAGSHGLESFAYLITNNTLPAFSGNVLVSILPFIAVVANSPMFLLLMGLEMGALVVFRIRRIKWLEKRINLSFALLAYFTYTLYGPKYIVNFDKLPLWANVGALGPVRGDLIIPMLLSYVLYAVLVLFFGRRAYCGTLCPSAVMYGGTLGQEMISLNYKSKVSKKNIGSRYSSVVKQVISGAWIFMLISAFLSFAISIHILNLPYDPAILYSYMVWNALWYFFFVSIPFVGMSPCRRYGWCTTGTFMGFFSRLGFFKIKAVDSNVCLRCPTKDCVVACEVGLGDLPAQFIKNGYFKSQKCVGSGSCISACPYDNIHFYDVRNVIKERLGAKRTET